MGRKWELPLMYRQRVWQAYLRLERTGHGRVRRGEIKSLLQESRLVKSQLHNIIQDGKAGKLEMV